MPISIIPLPDKHALPSSPAHLSMYQEFPTGATVMALYPDTSCFYRAEVIASPKETSTQGRVSQSIDRVESVRTVLIRSRFRAPERRTINSNLKMTTTRNTWSRRQRSWNGLAHETYCRPDVPRERGHCALRSPFIFVILAQISEHPPEVGVSDVYHYHHRHQHSSRDPRRRRGIAQHGFSFRVSAVVQPGGGG